MTYKNEVSRKQALRSKELVVRGRCPRCSNKNDRELGYLCSRCLEKSRLNQLVVRDQRNAKNGELRKQVVDHYGGVCACCGEGQHMFLAFDHVDNDGAVYRRDTKGHCIVAWIIKNNYPDSIQVLCFNCNHGKYLNGGVCPHANSV